MPNRTGGAAVVGGASGVAFATGVRKHVRFGNGAAFGLPERGALLLGISCGGDLTAGPVDALAFTILCQSRSAFQRACVVRLSPRVLQNGFSNQFIRDQT